MLVGPVIVHHPNFFMSRPVAHKVDLALGNAGISTKHTLALVNRGGASADELLALKEQIQKAVADKFGILLQPEPVFVGFDRTS